MVSAQAAPPGPVHAHSHDGPAAPVGTRVRIALACCLAPFLIATVVGAVLLWPAHRHFTTPSQFQTAAGRPVSYVAAVTAAVRPAPCGPDAAGAGVCRDATFSLGSGRSAHVLLATGAGEPVVRPGDRVTLARTADAQGRTQYYFDDFRRGRPLALLAACFAVLAVLVGRARGAAALAGLAVAFAALIEFVLPALLSGSSPVLVALVAGSAVMTVVLYIGHGFTARTTVAVLGTLTGLGLVGAVGALAVSGTRLTGLSSDELTAVQATTGHLDVSGLLLAGLVIGSLGVLNDVTVTQASAVWELHAANPLMPRGRLYAAAMRIGRDHIASTIYTLLLAYAGAALPVLLLFTLGDQPFGVAVNGDLVASDIVRSLVGGVGLLLAVPITTAAAVAVRTYAGPAAAKPVRRARASNRPDPPRQGDATTPSWS
ncbi:MAG: YibE/F family protein [Mycobacteriales bacterium]